MAVVIGLYYKTMNIQHGENPMLQSLNLVLKAGRHLSLQGANGFGLNKIDSNILNVKI